MERKLRSQALIVQHWKHNLSRPGVSGLLRDKKHIAFDAAIVTTKFTEVRSTELPLTLVSGTKDDPEHD